MFKGVSAFRNQIYHRKLNLHCLWSYVPSSNLLKLPGAVFPAPAERVSSRRVTSRQGYNSLAGHEGRLDVLMVRDQFTCPRFGYHKYPQEKPGVFLTMAMCSVCVCWALKTSGPHCPTWRRQFTERHSEVSLPFRKYTEKNNWKQTNKYFFPPFLPHLLPWEPAGSQMSVSSNWKLSPLLLKSFHKALSYFIKSLNEFSRY